MRTFGVEEEFLLVDARTLLPVPLGEAAVSRHQQQAGGPIPPGHASRGGKPPLEFGPDSGPQLEIELQQEQMEVAGPPRRTLDEQLGTILLGREMADRAARALGARVVALASPVAPQLPHLVTEERLRTIGERFGLVGSEQLTCGLHVHVAVDSREEGIGVLDRIRVWLPVLLALSTNSPFWYGQDSGFSSYRYQAWCRWPMTGPNDVFGSPAAYDRQTQVLKRSGVAFDDGMLYYDARLSSRYPTVEVRIADVCADARHAAVIATLVRALVETTARQWHAGVAAPMVRAAELRAWSWLAARSGLEEGLVSPVVGEQRPAGEVVAALLELVREVLAEYGEQERVEAVVSRMLRNGTGSRLQRAAYAERGDSRDVVEAVLQATHRQDTSFPETPSADGRDGGTPRNGTMGRC